MRDFFAFLGLFFFSLWQGPNEEELLPLLAGVDGGSLEKRQSRIEICQILCSQKLTEKINFQIRCRIVKTSKRQQKNNSSVNFSYIASKTSAKQWFRQFIYGSSSNNSNSSRSSSKINNIFSPYLVVLNNSSNNIFSPDSAPPAAALCWISFARYKTEMEEEKMVFEFQLSFVLLSRFSHLAPLHVDPKVLVSPWGLQGNGKVANLRGN